MVKNTSFCTFQYSWYTSFIRTQAIQTKNKDEKILRDFQQQQTSNTCE